MHYDKACCEAQAKFSDSDRHCLESLPKLQYDKLIDELNTTLKAMSICNSANTCSDDIDFLEIVRQAENLYEITDGGATLAAGAADHLQNQSVNLNTINTGLLPTIDMASGATLRVPVSSTIDVSDGATFLLPNIEFSSTAAAPTTQGHMKVGAIETSVDFNSQNLSEVNLDLATLRIDHVSVTAKAIELNILKNATINSTELSKLTGLQTTTQELNQLAGLNLSKAQLSSLHGLPTLWASTTTRYAGSLASSLAEAETACEADLDCEGYSQAWAATITFSITTGKVMPGTLGASQNMPNNHISDCTNLITSNAHYAILVDTTAYCQVISDGNLDSTTWTDDASKKLYLRNSEFSYGAATTGDVLSSKSKGVGQSADAKVLTAAADGNVQIMKDVTIEGDLDVPLGVIHIDDVALTVSALDLNEAGQLKSELTVSVQEVNRMTGIQSTVAELNTMQGVTANATDLNRSDVAQVGVSAASKVLVTDNTGNINLQHAEGSFNTTLFNYEGRQLTAETLNKAVGLKADLSLASKMLVGSDAMTFDVDLSVEALTFGTEKLMIKTEVPTYKATNVSYAGTACNGTSDCETACSADSSCAGYSLGAPVF